MNARTILGVLALVTLVPAAATAHHGWSSYDSSKPLTVTGVIKEAGYEHPHGHIALESPGKTWSVVLAPPSRMQSRGLAKEDLVVGATVTVEAYPRRDGEPEMRAERITLNGKTAELR